LFTPCVISKEIERLYASGSKAFGFARGVTSLNIGVSNVEAITILVACGLHNCDVRRRGNSNGDFSPSFSDRGSAT
jgi:hypothetical protein